MKLNSGPWRNAESGQITLANRGWRSEAGICGTMKSESSRGRIRVAERRKGIELIWRKGVCLVGGWLGEMWGGSVDVERWSFGEGWGFGLANAGDIWVLGERRG